MEATKSFDAAKADAFAGTLVDTFNKASLTLMISLGHRSGLFDSMHGSEPSTSVQIANNANLHERYVREWLNAMVTGGIVDYDVATNSYHLPDEHGALLTRQAGPENLAIFAEFIPAAAQVEDDILECFKHGGGVKYDKYHKFYHAMGEDTSVQYTFMNGLLPSLPELEEKLTSGIRVVDLGCGSGALVIELASRFPNSNFTGIDLTDYVIVKAKQEAKSKGLTNLEFKTHDLTDYETSAAASAYDLIITIDAIHDQQKPMSVLRGIHKALRDNGTYIMVDIKGTGHVNEDMNNPFAPLLYSISCMHCVAVSMGQGGEGLGAMWGEEKAKEFVTKAGFASVETKNFPSDPINNWYVVRKR